MSFKSILQKSARASRRVRVKASCTIKVLGTSDSYIVEICDVSQTGLGFYIRGTEFDQRTPLQIDFLNAKPPISLRGSVRSQREMLSEDTRVLDSKVRFRCSVGFDQALSEKQFLALLSFLDISSPEIKNKVI